MVWLDIQLRRFGIVFIVLALPGLVLPVVAVVHTIVDDRVAEAGLSLIILAIAWLVSVAMWVGLVYLTFRSYRPRLPDSPGGRGTPQEATRLETSDPRSAG